MHFRLRLHSTPERAHFCQKKEKRKPFLQSTEWRFAISERKNGFSIARRQSDDACGEEAKTDKSAQKNLENFVATPRFGKLLSGDIFVTSEDNFATQHTSGQNPAFCNFATL